MHDYGGGCKKHFPQRVNNTFFLSTVHSEELIKETKYLDPKKSSGLDDIRAKMIIMRPNIFGENLTKISTNVRIFGLNENG